MAAPKRPYRQRAERDSDATAPDPTAKPRRRMTASAPEPGAVVEVVLVGGSLAGDAEYIAALRHLENTGVLRVRATVASPAADDPGLHGSFLQAEARPALDAVDTPPGALVVLATPPRLHPAQANAAMKRGWHVVCATPLACSVHDANLMITAAQRQERMLAADVQRRFFPAAQFLRSLCRDHLLGPLFRFSIHEGCPPVARDAAPATSGKPETPDSVLLDFGTRILDLLTWSIGTATLTRYADDSMGGVEANALLELAFGDGVRGTVHLSSTWPTSNTWHFIFERGIVRWDVAHGNRVSVQLASAPAAFDGVLTHPLTVDDTLPGPTALASRTEAIVAQLQHVIGVMAGRESLRFHIDDAVRSLALFEECHARRTLLDHPWFSRNEAARARTLSTPTGIRRP